MGSKKKQMLIRQKAAFEHELQERLSFLAGKGIKSPKAEKDTIVRKLKADIKAGNNRLRLVADERKENGRNGEDQGGKGGSPPDGQRRPLKGKSPRKPPKKAREKR